MKTYRVVIVNKRTSVTQSLQWCFEHFEGDEIMTKTKLEPGELVALQADILLIDVRNFLRLSC